MVKAGPRVDNPTMDDSTPTYEIRICNSRHQASLILVAECRNDVAAIFMARNFIRRGEGAEVWRDDTLVYRLEPRVTGKTVRPAKPTRQPVSNLNLQWWIPVPGERNRHQEPEQLAQSLIHDFGLAAAGKALEMVRKQTAAGNREAARKWHRVMSIIMDYERRRK